MKKNFLFAIALVVAACSDNGSDAKEFNAAEDCPAEGLNKYGMPNRGTFIDERDGREYKYTTIGGQVWMAQNLNYHFDEDSLEQSYESWMYTASCRYPEDDCAEKGRNYVWEKACYACPAGWHLPSKEDWQILFDNVGGIETAGDMLKSTEGWLPLNPGEQTNGDDVCGMNIYSTAVCNIKTGFSSGFWTSSFEDEKGYLNVRFESYEHNASIWDNLGTCTIHSVRCVKD